MARLLCLLCCSVIALPAWSKRAHPPEEPTPTVADPTDPVALIEAAAAALGGAAGGHRALAALPGYRMSFRMEVNDPYEGKHYTADHVFERGLDGSLRLEVTLVDGEGVDSVAHVGADGSWVEADGQRTEFAAEEVRSRVDDFSPERLFQVPLELASQGLESLPAEVRDRLLVEPPAAPDAADEAAGEPAGDDDSAAAPPATHVVRAVDDGDDEQLRIVLDAATYHPLEASFASVAGRITYRFADFREVAPALVLPHRRTFLRNGVLLSDLTLTAFEVLGKPPAGGAKGADAAGDPTP